MTWTRLDDGWTDRPILEQLPHEVRWHYLALIQFCSRTGRYDGLVRAADAQRCSDVPDPAAANAALVDVGLLVTENSAIRLPLIEEHVPPPHLRDETRKQSQRERKRRERAHRAGNHDLCHAETCNKVSSPVTSDVTRDTGTGQDGPGRENGTRDETNDWSGAWQPGSGERYPKRDDREDQPGQMSEASESVKTDSNASDAYPAGHECRECKRATRRALIDGMCRSCHFAGRAAS